MNTTSHDGFLVGSKTIPGISRIPIPWRVRIGLSKHDLICQFLYIIDFISDVNGYADPFGYKLFHRRFPS